MKKILPLIVMMVLFTGCTALNDKSNDEIVNTILKSNIKLFNQYRTGYKYYLPRNLTIRNDEEYNEVITNKNTKYYLYIDIISYYNKTNDEYKICSDCFYSKEISYKNKIGYLEINIINGKYLVEMMYNYAKIEVMVDKVNIKDAIINSMTILSSIKYNDAILTNLLVENIISSNEELYDIFTTKKDDNIIKWEKYDDEYNSKSDIYVPDLDIIK